MPRLGCGIFAKSVSTLVPKTAAQLDSHIQQSPWDGFKYMGPRFEPSLTSLAGFVARPRLRTSACLPDLNRGNCLCPLAPEGSPTRSRIWSTLHRRSSEQSIRRGCSRYTPRKRQRLHRWWERNATLMHVRAREGAAVPVTARRTQSRAEKVTLASGSRSAERTKVLTARLKPLPPGIIAARRGTRGTYTLPATQDSPRPC